jgi:hypothetical protein
VPTRARWDVNNGPKQNKKNDGTEHELLRVVHLTAARILAAGCLVHLGRHKDNSRSALQVLRRFKPPPFSRGLFSVQREQAGWVLRQPAAGGFLAFHPRDEQMNV